MNSELDMLDKLPEGYHVYCKEFDGGIKVIVEISKMLVVSELIPQNIDSFMFTIICDGDFPFKGPEVQCNTNFLQMSICDQRDLFINIVGAKWVPSSTLYEISKLIPEFITDAIINEAAEQRKFIGRFNLGSKYYIDDYFGVFDVWKFKDKTNMFIDYSKPQTQEKKNKLRYLLVSDTALMV
jgi:ubiquitin-protein ligase